MPNPYQYLSPDTQTRIRSYAEEAIRSGIPADDVFNYLENNSDAIITANSPAEPKQAFLDSIIGPMVEPSLMNIVALPLSFGTASMAGKLATRFLPNAGIRRLAVRFLADPAARDVEFEVAKRAGLERTFGALATIHDEPQFLMGLAKSFGMSVPFAVGSAIEAAHDDESPGGAFASTVATFAAFDTVLAGFGAAGRGVSRFFRSRVTEQMFRRTTAGAEIMSKYDDFMKFESKGPNWPHQAPQSEPIGPLPRADFTPPDPTGLTVIPPSYGYSLRPRPRLGPAPPPPPQRLIGPGEALTATRRDMGQEADFAEVLHDFLSVGGDPNLMLPANQAAMEQLRNSPVLRTKFVAAMQQRTESGGLPMLAESVGAAMTAIDSEAPQHAAAIRDAATQAMKQGLVEDNPVAQTILSAVRGDVGEFSTGNMTDKEMVPMLRAFGMTARDIAQMPSTQERRDKLAQLLEGVNKKTAKDRVVRSAPRPKAAKLAEIVGAGERVPQLSIAKDPAWLASFEPSKGHIAVISYPGIEPYELYADAKDNIFRAPIGNVIDDTGYRIGRWEGPNRAYADDIIRRAGSDKSRFLSGGTVTRAGLRLVKPAGEAAPVASTIKAPSVKTPMDILDDLTKGDAVTFPGPDGKPAVGRIVKVGKDALGSGIATVEYKHPVTGMRTKVQKPVSVFTPADAAAPVTGPTAAATNAEQVALNNLLSEIDESGKYTVTNKAAGKDPVIVEKQATGRLPRDPAREGALGAPIKFDWPSPDLVSRQVEPPASIKSGGLKFGDTTLTIGPDAKFFVAGQVYARNGEKGIDVHNMIFATVKLPGGRGERTMLVASGTKAQLEKLGYRIATVAHPDPLVARANITRAILAIAQRNRRTLVPDSEILHAMIYRKFIAGEAFQGIKESAHSLLGKAMPKGISDPLYDKIKRDLNIRAIRMAEKKSAIVVDIVEPDAVQVGLNPLESIAEPGVVENILNDTQIQLDLKYIREAKTIDADTTDLARLRRAEVKKRAAEAEARLMENEQFRALGTESMVDDLTVNAVAPEDVPMDVEWTMAQRETTSEYKLMLKDHPRTARTRDALRKFKLRNSEAGRLEESVKGMDPEDVINDLHMALTEDALNAGLIYDLPPSTNSRWLRGSAILRHGPSGQTQVFDLNKIDEMADVIDGFNKNNPLLNINTNKTGPRKPGRPC